MTIWRAVMMGVDALIFAIVVILLMVWLEDR
jgi:hypothetical protein